MSAWHSWQSLRRLGQLRTLAGDEPSLTQPDYAAVAFDGPTFVPVLRDSVTVEVPGLADAMALAEVAGWLLAERGATTRATFESPATPAFRPPEYRTTTVANGWLSAAEPATMSDVEEVVVVGNRIPVVGYTNRLCAGMGWDYRSVDEACSSLFARSYTQPGSNDLLCRRCRNDDIGGGNGGGGSGGGGSGGDGSDANDGDEQPECSEEPPPFGVANEQLGVPVPVGPPTYGVGSGGVTNESISLQVSCSRICDDGKWKWRMTGDVQLRLTMEFYTHLAILGTRADPNTGQPVNYVACRGGRNYYFLGKAKDHERDHGEQWVDFANAWQALGAAGKRSHFANENAVLGRRKSVDRQLYQC